MKILQIGPAWMKIPPEDYGGTEWVIANLIKGLSSLGHDVTLFSVKGSRVEGKINYIFKKGLLDEGIDWSAALPAFIHYHQALKNARKYDVVHAHLSSSTDLLLLPLLADLSDKGIPNLLTIHSRFPFDRYSYMDSLFLKLYGRKILAVNISKSMQTSLPGQFRDGGFVYNSLDVSKMKFSSSEGKYLTWIGRIIPEKGTAEAIKIAKKTGEQLIFAGIVDQYDEKSVKYFKQKIKPLIDGRQIKYLGPADLKLKNKLLKGAKAFLAPISWEEPFGMVFVESMACGTPVIVYNRGAAPEIIKDGKTGFIVSDQQEMIKAVKRIKEIKRQDCRNHAEKYFLPEAAALKHQRIYEKEIARQTGVSRERIFRVPVAPEGIFVNPYRHSPIVHADSD